MAAKIFQNTIIQMKDRIEETVGITDDRGQVISSSNLSLIGTVLDDFTDIDFESGIADGERIFITGERVYSPLLTRAGRLCYAAFVEGTGKTAEEICLLSAIAFNEAKTSYEEKHNKGAFIKNIISDNILPGDVYVRSKELHFITDEPRAVLVVRQVTNPDVAATETVARLFPDDQNDFVISMNDLDIVVIKRLEEDEDAISCRKIAKVIEKRLHEELNIDVKVGISTVSNHLRELADRYKEAQTAIDVGNIFDSENSIINYENLGLGRIIYQLPTTLCEMFLNEVFKRSSIEDLDGDTLDTINKFFENNLNVSETSRKLYVHRNTLVYRLEKIKKLTGLDLREFDHAIVFKVAMMVKMYLESLGGYKQKY